MGFTSEEKIKLQKGIADTYKSIRPSLKEHEELIWVLFHEVSPENWMFGPLNGKELRQKLATEKK
jgi:phenylpyruvate tautomerase PptA (4-oxalocrotonate tautomerase family)